MKRHIGWFIWLLISAACSASEIVAWKVPLSHFVWNGLESAGIVRCENPPEPSPFFKEGDELWKVGELPSDREKEVLSAEWVIWNASSGRLVAKGDWGQIHSLNDFIRPESLPKHCRLNVKLFSVVDGTLPMAVDSMPLAEVSLLARSGQKTGVSWSGDGNVISVEAEAIYGESEPSIYLLLFCSAKPADQAAFEVNTALTFRSEDTVWVARDFDGKQGLDLAVSGVIESLDGTPIRERVMIQTGEQTEPLILGGIGPSTGPIRIGESGWFARIWASPDEILDCIFPGQAGGNSDVDPFAEPSPEKSAPLPKTPSVKPPAILQPWLHHEVLDARKWFEPVGLVAGHAGDFIGYDPISESLFIHSSNKELVEHFQDLFTGFYCPGPPHLIVTLSGVGQTRLIAKSGQKASISRRIGDKETTRYLEIEPTLGEREDIMDLRFFFDDKTNPKKKTHLNTSVTLNIGDWSEIASGKLGEGERSSLRLKAEIFRPMPSN